MRRSVLFAFGALLVVASHEARATDFGAVADAIVARDSTLALLANRRLARHDSAAVCGEDAYRSDYSWFTDSSGVIRVFDYYGGSDDHADRTRSVYDAAGKLRYIRWRYGNVMGNWRITRRYFSPKGRLLLRQVEEHDATDETTFEPKPTPSPVAYLKTLCPGT